MVQSLTFTYVLPCFIHTWYLRMSEKYPRLASCKILGSCFLLYYSSDKHHVSGCMITATHALCLLFLCLFTGARSIKSRDHLETFREKEYN